MVNNADKNTIQWQEMEGINMIIYQKIKQFVPKYANYDYVKVYNGNDKFIGWIRLYFR